MTSSLWYDDYRDAVRSAIADSGRSIKDVAVYLFPHMKADSAYARLKVALNPDGDQELKVEQLVALCRFCSRFDPLYWMADECQHARPAPLVPEDERAKLQREYIEAVKHQARLIERLERLGAGLRVVAHPP